MSGKVAFITGVTGQDGAYLAELLLDKGYDVHGLKRRESLKTPNRLDPLLGDADGRGARLKLHYGDLTDTSAIIRLVAEIRPDEIYNLGAQSHVQVSFQSPEYTANADGLGALRLLEAMRILGLGRTTRFYQASTSELYGKAREFPQSEATPFHPRSPYGVAKLFAYWITINYREAYGFHASNGILFNHESPTRGADFVTRKITRAVAAIAAGRQDRMRLGNLDARRDWGHARDYVEGMHLILQRPEPDDYVLATGETRSVRDFASAAFRAVGVDIAWRGAGESETGVDGETGRVLVEVDPRHYRPAEVEHLVGDASKALRELGWRPRTSFDALVREMVEADLDALRRG